MEFGVWNLILLVRTCTEIILGLDSKLLSSDPTTLFPGVQELLFLLIVYLAVRSFWTFCKKKAKRKWQARARTRRRTTLRGLRRWYFGDAVAELQEIKRLGAEWEEKMRLIHLQSPLEQYKNYPLFEHLLCINSSCLVCRKKNMKFPQSCPAAADQASLCGSFSPSMFPLACASRLLGPALSSAPPGKPVLVLLLQTASSAGSTLPARAVTPLRGLVFLFPTLLLLPTTLSWENFQPFPVSPAPVDPPRFSLPSHLNYPNRADEEQCTGSCLSNPVWTPTSPSL